MGLLRLAALLDCFNTLLGTRLLAGALAKGADLFWFALEGLGAFGL